MSCPKEKYFKDIDHKKVLEYMFDQSCASSFAKGSIVELNFIDQMETKGYKLKKIKDHDKSKRYDFLANKNNEKITFEVKTIKESLSVDVGYKDPRKITLPSGEVWSTRSRHINERFDFLAVCLVNCDKFTIKDFIYIPFEEIPKIKKRKFTKEDCDFVESKYLALSFSLKKCEFKNVNKLCFF